MLRIGRGQRWHTIGDFTGDAQRLATAGQDFQFWTGVQQGFTDLRAGFDEMFAVIQHEQEGLWRADNQSELPSAALAVFSQVENGEQGLRDECWVGDGRKFHEPDAVGKLIQTFRAHLQTETRLARAARAGQRHQPRCRQQPFDLGNFFLAPDETGQLDGQVVGNALSD